MSDVIVENLRDFLGHERQAILSGALIELVDIAGRKHDLLGRMSPGASELATMHDELRRNQALLRSTIDGLREAVLRLAELRAARDGFRAYDSHGHRATVTAEPPTMERKA